MTTPTLILTRPRAASERFAVRLSERLSDGPSTLISPLFETVCRTDMVVPDGLDGLVLTSANAVPCLPDAALAVGVAYCVGRDTAQAAQGRGLHAVSADGAAVDLIPLVADRAKGQHLLHAHGRHPRGQVATHLEALGVRMSTAVVYDQVPCDLSEPARKAFASGDPIVVPVFSPRSADLLVAQGVALGACLCVAISTAAARPLIAAGAADVIVADAPEGDAMVDAVARLLETPRRLERGSPSS